MTARIELALCTLLLFVGVKPAAAIELSDYVGNYRLGSDHILAIAEWELDPQAPRVLAFTDLRSGRIGRLNPAGEDEFSLPSALLSGDEAARLKFLRANGVVTAAVFAEVNKAPRRAARVATRAHEVTIETGNTRLKGTLSLPPGKGPFPAVVMVPAGALGRTAVAIFPNFFLSRGFAVLAYDRRKETAALETYAADAVAAVELLRGRAEIDARRVGLWGSSQGGWLSLVAAGASPSVAFVIDYAGMLVPAWKQESYRIAAEGADRGASLETVQHAVAFHERMMRVAASGEGWSEIERLLAEKPAPAWHALVYKPSSLAELQRVWRDDFSFDPRPFAARVRQPVLALFGALDHSTPIESAAHLAHALRPSGKLTVGFFPTGNHALLDAKTGSNSEIPSLTHFAPGLLDEMSRWLRIR